MLKKSDMAHCRRVRRRLRAIHAICGNGARLSDPPLLRLCVDSVATFCVLEPGMPLVASGNRGENCSAWWLSNLPMC